MSRREFPRKVKIAAFERAEGRCEKCTAWLTPGKFEYDHRLPDALNGEPTLENCVVLCVACHKGKSRDDIGHIRKADRGRAKYIGAKAKTKRPLPFGRDSRLKKKVNGEVVRR